MKADTVTKDYVKDGEIFVDIFNYFIYDGQQVIRPEQLTERDCVKTDGKNQYVLYGEEAVDCVYDKRKACLSNL